MSTEIDMREHTIISQVSAMLIHGTMGHAGSQSQVALLCAEYFKKKAVAAETLGMPDVSALNSMIAMKLEKFAKSL